MNRGQPVAELVRDTPGQSAKSRQCVLEPELLLELRDLGEIGKQADGGRRLSRLVVERRDGHADVQQSPGALDVGRPPGDDLR